MASKNSKNHKVVTYNLNKIIDVNYYLIRAVSKAHNSLDFLTGSSTFSQIDLLVKKSRDFPTFHSTYLQPTLKTFGVSLKLREKYFYN